MKWFKHISESGDDPDIGAIENEFGFKGYYMFFRTIEIMSKEFSIGNPGENTFNFQWFLGRFSRKIDRKTLLKFYNFTMDLGRISYEMNGKNIHLKCTKLRDLTDEYTDKLLAQLSGQTPDKIKSKSRTKNKKKEVRNKNINNIIGQNELDQLFEKWWSRYPKSADKGEAKRKWLTNVSTYGVDTQKLEDALTGYINILNKNETPVFYIKHAKTFLYPGNKQKKIPPTWEQFLKFADPKYKAKPEY